MGTESGAKFSSSVFVLKVDGSLEVLKHEPVVGHLAFIINFLHQLSDGLGRLLAAGPEGGLQLSFLAVYSAHGPAQVMLEHLKELLRQSPPPASQLMDFHED